MKHFSTVVLTPLTLGACLLALAQLPRPALAQQPRNAAAAPMIRKVDISEDRTQILVFGKNFCLNPVVKLSTITLTVESVDLSGPELIVADLPAFVDPAGTVCRSIAGCPAGATASSGMSSSAAAA